MSIKILEYLGLIISIHPLVFIFINRKYAAQKKDESYYISKDFLSIFATNKISIILSIISYFYMIRSELFFYGLPLASISYICFIRDRFKSIARGQGAPGYFSFLFINTLFFSKLLTLEILNQSFLGIFVLNISKIIFIILFFEYGFIFFSAGLFKILISKKEPIATSLALLNPMWSNFVLETKYIQILKNAINWIGPIVQIISGIFIISGIKFLQIIGFIGIAVIFISITPFYKLSWLCPSIASTAILNITLISRFEFINPFLIIILVSLRGLVLIRLFLEFFKDKKTSILFENLLNKIYRKYLGVIIWRVLTFDLVRIVAPTNSKLDDFNKTKSNKKFIKICNQTNVYESITLTSLIASKQYLDKGKWKKRFNHYMKINNRKNIVWIITDPKKANKNFENHNPFINCKIKKIKIDDKLSNNGNEDLNSFLVYNHNNE